MRQRGVNIGLMSALLAIGCGAPGRSAPPAPPAVVQVPTQPEPTPAAPPVADRQRTCVIRSERFYSTAVVAPTSRTELLRIAPGAQATLTLVARDADFKPDPQASWMMLDIDDVVLRTPFDAATHSIHLGARGWLLDMIATGGKLSVVAVAGDALRVALTLPKYHGGEVVEDTVPCARLELTHRRALAKPRPRLTQAPIRQATPKDNKLTLASEPGGAPRFTLTHIVSVDVLEATSTHSLVHWQAYSLHVIGWTPNAALLPPGPSSGSGGGGFGRGWRHSSMPPSDRAVRCATDLKLYAAHDGRTVHVGHAKAGRTIYLTGTAEPWSHVSMRSKHIHEAGRLRAASDDLAACQSVPLPDPQPLAPSKP